LRFGFTQVWRRKGKDGADLHFHSIVHATNGWLLVKRAVEHWLLAENFDAEGRERRSLEQVRQELISENEV